MDILTDNSLMLKVKAGDLDKMGLLFERYHKPLFGFLYHATGQRVESEDLVQTVFYRMLKYRHTYSGEGEFRTWMYHLARNALIDSAKKANRIAYQADITVASEMQQQNYSETDNMLRDEAGQLMQLAMKKLKSDQREVLIMSKFQELPYKEIAEILKTTEANIKVKVYRAIQDLRKEF